MTKALDLYKIVSLAGALSTAPFIYSDDIILHANFDADELGSPNPFPPSEPASDYFTFDSGTYNVVADPLVPGNQFLDCLAPFYEARINAYVDTSFGSANDVDKYFEVAWTSSVGEDTSATIELRNGNSTSFFLRYDGPSQLIQVNDANGAAIPTSIPVSFAEDIFQDFLLRVDFATESFSLEIDGEIAVQDAPLIAGALKGISELQFRFVSDNEFGAGGPPIPGAGIPFGYFSLDEIYIARTEPPVLEETIAVSFEVRNHALSYRGLHCFNKNIRFLVPVIIHGSPELDVEQLDLESLALNGLELKSVRDRALYHIRDLSGPEGKRDGYPDLFGYFAFNSDDWEQGEETFYVLSGFLDDGTLIAGSADRPRSRYSWLRRHFRR